MIQYRFGISSSSVHVLERTAQFKLTLIVYQVFVGKNYATDNLNI